MDDKSKEMPVNEPPDEIKCNKNKAKTFNVTVCLENEWKMGLNGEMEIIKNNFISSDNDLTVLSSSALIPCSSLAQSCH